MQFWFPCLKVKNELYNNRIVDVSYYYEKNVCVIRPQFFIPMISLLRNAALKTLEYKRKLEVVREQNIYIEILKRNFENFKHLFSRSCRLANDRFNAA